jgi:signal transduction histidine kinase/ligand-binding sensor domain-containing protein
MPLRIIFLFFLLSVIVSCIPVKESVAQDAAPAYQLVKHYTSDNGLPQNSIKTIAEGNRGFVWLATESGLVRYDGRHFKIYSKSATGFISGRFVAIKKDFRSGTMYAITDLREVLEIRNGDASLLKQSLTKIFPPVFGSGPALYNSWGEIFNYHQNHKSQTDSFQFSMDRDNAVVVYRNNNIRWYNKLKEVATLPFDHKEQLNSFVIIRQKLYFFPDSRKGEATLIEPGGTSVRKIRGDFMRQPANIPFSLEYNTASGASFIISSDKLYIITEKADGSLDTRLLLSGFNFDEHEINTIHYDESRERIFLGSSINGLYIYEKKKFYALTAPGNFKNNVFYGQISWKENAVLTGKGIKLSLDSPPEYFFRSIAPYADQFGATIQRFMDGTIWVADEQLLYQFAPDAKTLLKSWKMSSKFTLFQGLDSTIWISVHDDGLYRLRLEKQGAQPEFFLHNREYAPCMLQENEDILWIGTISHLYRVNLKTKHCDTVLNNKSVRSLYMARKNEIWVTTYEDGIYLLRNGKVFHMPLDKKENIKFAHCILEDKSGFFWITTNNGLYQVSRRDLIGYALGVQKDVFYFHYTKEQGFNTNEFNGGCMYNGLKLANGYFSFPSINGLVWFRPDEIKPDLPEQEIVIDGIQVDSLEIRDTDVVMIKQEFSRINILFATSYFGNPDNLQFEYRLTTKNVAGKWFPLENEFVSFTSLPVGKNEVTIRKKTGFGIDNYTYAKVTILIPPDWWETWWFKSLVTLGFTLFVWAFIAIRLKLLQRKNKALEETVARRTLELQNTIGLLEQSEQELGKELHFQKRLNASIAHDIKTPLKYLTLSLKYLSGKIRNKEMPAQEETDQIYTSADRIYHFTSSLTGYMKVRLGSDTPALVKLWELTEQKAGLFSNSAAELHNKFVNDIDRGIHIISYVHLLDLVLHNLIDNAIKYTRNGTIRFFAEQYPDYILLQVSDTGIGMNSATTAFYNDFFSIEHESIYNAHIGLGFLTIKDALPILHASLYIESEEGKGTTFKMHILKNP